MISDACGSPSPLPRSRFLTRGSSSSSSPRRCPRPPVPPHLPGICRGLVDFRPADLSPPPLSFFLSRRAVPQRTLLANQIGSGPRPLGPTARIFRLLIVDRLFAIDHGNTGKTQGNSVIGRQPSTFDSPSLPPPPR